MTRPILPDLVGNHEIAARCHIGVTAVNNWHKRKRQGDTPFPTPILSFAMGPVWWWPDVAEWLYATGREKYLTGPTTPRLRGRRPRATD